MFHYPLNEIILGPFTILYFPQLHSTVHTYCAALPLPSSFFIPNLLYFYHLPPHDSENLPWLSWLNVFLYLAHFPLSLHLYYSTCFPISGFYLRPLQDPEDTCTIPTFQCVLHYEPLWRTTPLQPHVSGAASACARWWWRHAKQSAGVMLVRCTGPHQRNYTATLYTPVRLHSSPGRKCTPENNFIHRLLL